MKIALALPLTLLPVLAQAADIEPDARFKRLDRDRDGRLSPEELPMPQFFRQLDRDGDGFLTPAEVEPLGRARRDKKTIVEEVLPRLPGYGEIKVDGRRRQYLVHAPKRARGPLPVLIVFHGGGGNAASAARFGFKAPADRERFLVVYPQGIDGHWNDGREAPALGAQREAVDDVKFVRRLVDELAKTHALDRSRIFATGVSNGGIFCHRLAAEASGLFAAVAPVIGGMAEPLAPRFRPEHPVSLLVIQGDADALVPIDGGPIGRGALGRRGNVIALDEAVAKYVQLNRIAGDPTLTPLDDADPDDGTTTTLARYPAGADGFRVDVYRVRGGGHTMPGGRPRAGTEALVGKTSGDFDGPEVICAFFRSCPARKQPAEER